MQHIKGFSNVFLAILWPVGKQAQGHPRLTFIGWQLVLTGDGVTRKTVMRYPTPGIKHTLVSVSKNDQLYTIKIIIKLIC